jgi:hypothetical protein
MIPAIRPTGRPPVDRQSEHRGVAANEGYARAPAEYVIQGEVLDRRAGKDVDVGAFLQTLRTLQRVPADESEPGQAASTHAARVAQAAYAAEQVVAQQRGRLVDYFI